MYILIKILSTVVVVIVLNQTAFAEKLEGEALRENIIKRLPKLNHTKFQALMKRVGKEVPKGYFQCFCNSYSIMGTGIGYSPNRDKHCDNTDPCKGGNWGCSSYPLPSDLKVIERCIISAKYDDNSTIIDVIENRLRYQSAYHPCAEADFFYDGKTLYGFYTGKPSLAQNRVQLIGDFKAMALQWELETERNTTLGSSLINAPFIAQSFDSGALPTGKEDALHACAKQMVAERDKPLKPAEFFYCALKVTDGDIDQALITAHAALYRDPAKDNAVFIDEHLAPIRMEEAYSDKKVIEVWNAQKKSVELVSAKETASYDQQGAWYHLFGMMALEMADRQSLVPFAVLQVAVEHYKPVHAAALAGGFPKSHDCGTLSNYAIALENQVRSNMRRAPDPDKQCVNYNGCAVGAALYDWYNQRHPITIPSTIPSTIEPTIQPVVRPER